MKPYISTEDLYKLFIQCNQKISTDTRKLEIGSLFFALKGDNFDANEFSESAIQGGCTFAIVDDEKRHDNSSIFLVENVLESLQQLAKYHRQQLKFPIIGITGSNGCITQLVQTVLVSTSQPTISGKNCSVVVNNPTGQGIVNHTLSSSVSTNAISLRTLTGTITCNSGQIGVYGITGLATLYTNASPGFVDGATVYTNISLTNLAPDGVVFRYPNSVNSTVYQIVSDGVMSFTGTYGGPC